MIEIGHVTINYVWLIVSAKIYQEDTFDSLIQRVIRFYINYYS